MALVSIITPVYNAEHWLPQTLACVQAQTFTDWQHCLIDDGSSDASTKLIAAAVHADDRIIALRTDTNAGPAAARNLGLQHARGRYLAFLDADDLWLPTKLERHIAWKQATGHAFSYHDYRHMSVDGHLIGARVQGPDVLNLKTLHTRRGFGCLTAMIDRHQIPDFAFPVCGDRGLPEDFLAWLWVIKRGHVGHRLEMDLARYRLSIAGRSANKWLAAKRIWQIYRNETSLPWSRALSWWGQYAWNSLLKTCRSRPTLVDEPSLVRLERPAEHGHHISIPHGDSPDRDTVSGPA